MRCNSCGTRAEEYRECVECHANVCAMCETGAPCFKSGDRHVFIGPANRTPPTTTPAETDEDETAET